MGQIGKIGREFPNELQMDDNNRTDCQTYLTGSLFSNVSISYLHIPSLGKIVIIFVPWYIHEFENIVLVVQKNRLIEMVLLSTHNICLRGKKNNFLTKLFKNAPTFSKNYYKIQPWD